MNITVSELIDRLSKVKNQGAVVIFSVNGIGDSHLSDVIDQTQDADKDGVIGNLLLVSDQLNEVFN